MNQNTQKLALSAIAACAAIGISVVSIGPALASPTAPAPGGSNSSSAATHTPNEIERMININRSGHDLDMTIVTGNGTTLHELVHPGKGWCPEAEFGGTDTITVKDGQGVAFVGTFTYDGDWIGGHMDKTPRLNITWHTGPFGGYDFR